MADELQRVGVVFKEEGSVKFVKTLKEVNAEISKNYLEFKKTQAQWDKTTSASEKLSFQIENLGKALKLQEDKATALRAEISKLENAEESSTEAQKKNQQQLEKKRKELEKTEIKIVTYTKKLESMKSELNNTGKKIEEFGTKVQNVGDKMEKAGKKLSAFSTVTGAALVASAKSAIDFEDAFTGVEKTVDGTEKQMEELKQGIRDMAKEIPSTTTEISGVAEAAGQLGIKTEDILSFTKVMIDLGNSTNLSAEEAASSLAKFANITNMSAKDYDKLGSTIVALGNNFATTEADIVEMSTRLASTGKLAGLSQSQILSLATAMSSVGIEAEAGGSAMSKLLKKIQVACETGSKDLDKFAKVAGMTSKDFKDAFQKDAVKALTKFIGGLNNTERNGKSAIAVLDDMGIKEVRLSNTILSLASASDLMNEAVETGTKAWEDNTALTNEANKRYGTLKSQIEIAINKLKDIAITIGNKLMPYISKLIDGIQGVANWFSDLNDEQVETIVNIGLVVTALGPLLSIFGKITSVAGGAIKGIGTFTQAIGVAKGTVTSTSTAVNGLAKVINGLTSPTGLAVAGITAVAGALIYLATQETEQQKKAKELAKSIGDAKTSLEEYNQKVDETASTELSHINNVQKLKTELDTLVDENGKVKKSDEGRANFIINQLNGALGTEIELTDGQIQNYKDLQTEVDKLIEKKRAEIQLAAEEEKYKNAIQNREQATKNLEETLSQLGISYEEAKAKADEYYKKMQDGTLTVDDLKDTNFGLITSFVEADEQVKTYTEQIKQYEDDYAKYTDEKYNEVGQSVKNTTEDWTDNTLQEISDSIAKQKEQLDHYKQIYEARGDEISKQSYEQAQNNLNNLTTELRNRTKTVGNLSKDEIKAWATLAVNDYEAFKKGIENLDPTVKEKLNSVADVVIKDRSIADNMDALADAAQIAFQSNDSTQWGRDMIQGMANGIIQKTSTSLQSAVWGASNLIRSWLHFSKPDVGPLREYEKWMPDMVKGLSNSLDKSSPTLIKSVKKMAGDMSNELQDINYETEGNPKQHNSNSITTKVEIDYNKMADAITKALTNCKFTLDEDGFAKIVKDELYKVV